jgi:uncharacterized repeat protein (TIGR03803 family)
VIPLRDMKYKINRALFAAVVLMLGALLPVCAQSNFEILHTFDVADGANPQCNLILSGNRLYGTTYLGGSLTWGTVFAVNTDSTSFTNLYTFGGTNDGAYPRAGLILSGNTLYGTASSGGSGIYGSGTVFAIQTNGTGFTNLYVFGGTNDGASPQASLILSGNTLYGTTVSGGTNGNGVVFAVHVNGTGFTNIHNFTDSDGFYPQAGLILSGDKLYGTTEYGGNSGDGTVFTINTNGTDFTNLYVFGGTNDGSNPQAGLILSGNILYGTASYAGAWNNGTVFAVSTNGTGFTNLYSFNGNDGSMPLASLILSGNILYGTTRYGSTNGEGIVFAINTNGTGFTNLYSFTPTSGNYNVNNEGAEPYTSLTLSNNTLYGAAYWGGSSGNGTVFALSLPVPSLGIVPTGNQIVLSWPTSAANFSLQTSPDLFNWRIVTNGITAIASNYVLTNTASSQSAFFRLKSQ